MAVKLSLEKIEAEIQKAKPEKQRQFLARLPYLLGIAEENWEFLKLSEPSFDFWNNPYDDAYNSL